MNEQTSQHQIRLLKGLQGYAESLWAIEGNLPKKKKKKNAIKCNKIKNALTDLSLHFSFARCVWMKYQNGFAIYRNGPTAHSSFRFCSPVSRLCLCIIDSQRLLLLANRLLRQFFFFQREGNRWSDEIHVTFGWPLLDKDSLHQLSSVIIRGFYAGGLFVSFVGFFVEHHASS